MWFSLIKNIVFVQGVQFLLVAVHNFEDSGNSEKTLFICSLCLWWRSMIDATLIHYPEAMCTAVKDLANDLKGENLSWIRRVLREEVCACVCLCLLIQLKMYVCAYVSMYDMPSEF